jgi:hypothetical protein
MSRWAAACSAAALALVVLVTVAVGSNRSSGRVAPADVRAMALRVAVSMGDSHPSGGRVFETTRTGAMKALADSPQDTDQPVYFVVIHGHFVGAGLSRPSGAPVQTGSTIAIVWDPIKQQVTDFHLGENELDTSSLGAGVSLF